MMKNNLHLNQIKRTSKNIKNYPIYSTRENFNYNNLNNLGEPKLLNFSSYYYLLGLKLKSDEEYKRMISESEKEKETFIKIAGYTNQLTYDFLGIHDDTLTDFEKYEKFNKFVTNPTKFEMVKEYFEELKVDEKMCEEIEEIETTTWKDKIRKQFLEKMNEEEAKNFTPNVVLVDGENKVVNK